ncbi:helix-turn-helix domain-containing protein [Empedobacter falsenii]|uniref:Helix-turn-helix domain-containing protein n=1 Tax=Empedobacter falsenii TaxID=343874 RepID=A0AAW7DJU8_9FLAO|nr:helix-turn-helix domain-containing protein [Empedobacter falsenii]MDM1550920.1 helix-turn-helix domain-containing protein [Empedobacter falsenii]
MEQLQFVGLSPEQFLAEIKKAVAECLVSQQQDKKKEDEKDFFTSKEVQQILSVSPTTLYNWEKSGKLLPSRIGHRVYYSRSIIENSFKSA